MIDIKNISGNILLSTLPNDGCKRKFTLMKEDYILLKFSLDNPIYFKLGSYVECDFGLFEVCNLQKPAFNANTAGYDYELQLDAYYWKWKNKIFKYTPETAGQEASWNLTASLDVQAGIVLRNLKALGYTYKGQDFDFSIDSTVENKSQLMSYDNINILDACFEMAKKWDCECWVTENIIHFGRCEFGDPVDFEIGVNVGEMSRSESQSTYATRIYAFGSTRNIPTNYRPVDESVVVNGVVQKRLMLPEGTPYIDAYPNMTTEEAIEQIVSFDEVYPRRLGTMSDVTTHEYTETIENADGTTTEQRWIAYRFKDTGITFSKDYILPGEELKITFQSGKLNGMVFAVTFDPEGKDEQLWEIVRNEDYGRPLPDEVLIPENGDTYVLSGWDSTKIAELGLVSSAEQELKDKAEKYVAKSKIDPNTYNCTMMSDDAYHEDGIHNLYGIGQRVNLINKAYFENGRQSRIIGFEFNLDYPFDSPIYMVGETAAYSRIGELEDKIDSITLAGQTYTFGGGSGVYLIHRNDSTPASDSNVFSALRSLAEFISKKKPDQTNFLIKVLAGIEAGLYSEGATTGSKLHKDGLAEFGRIQANGDSEFRGNLSSKDFISGFTSGKGWAIWFKDFLNSAGIIEKLACMEVDELTVRRVLRVFTFIISQMLGENDNHTFTSCLEVDHYDPETGKIYLKTKDGQLYNPFRKDDCVMVQQFNGMPSEENGYYVTKYYELLIAEAGCGSLGDKEKRLDWVTFTNFSTTMEGTADTLIKEHDTLVRVDNLSDPDRKGIIQLMAVGNHTPYIDFIYGKKTDSENALKGRFGNLQGIYNHLFGWLKGFGAYLTNLYAVGEFRMAHTGEDIADKFEMVQGAFRTQFRQMQYNMTEEANFFTNASFLDNLSGWVVGESHTKFFLVGDKPIYMNKNLYTDNSTFVGLASYGGKSMLRISNSEVRQPNGNIRKPGTHKEYRPSITEITEGYVEVPDTLYLSIRYICTRSGELSFGFSREGVPVTDVGALPYTCIEVTKGTDYVVLQYQGTWAGEGDFEIKCTGEVYVDTLSLTDHPLDNYKIETSTKFEQDASHIAILGNRINKAEGAITNLGIELNSAKESIRLYAQKVDANTASISQLKITVDGIDSAVTSVEGDIAAAEARIETVRQLAVKAGEAEVYRQSSDPWNNWSGGTESKHVGALWYNTSDSHVYRYVGYDGTRSWEDVTNAMDSATYVMQNKSKWTAIATNFYNDGSPKESSGFVTTGNFSSMFSNALDANGDVVKQADLRTYVRFDPNTGEVTSGVRISADLVDINGFSVVTGNSMKIGNFLVKTDSLESSDGSDSMLLSAGLIRFLGSNANVYIGSDTIPSVLGGTLTAPVRISVERNISSSGYGNVGLHLSVKGSSSYDDNGYQYTGNHALFIPKGDICGFRLRTRRISTSQTLNVFDSNVICVNTSGITVTLPSGCEDGQEYWMNSVNGKTVNVSTLGGAVITNGGGSFNNSKWQLYKYDKHNNRWFYSYMNG